MAPSLRGKRKGQQLEPGEGNTYLFLLPLTSRRVSVNRQVDKSYLGSGQQAQTGGGITPESEGSGAFGEKQGGLRIGATSVQSQ